MLCLVTQSGPTLWPHGQQPAKFLCPWGFSRQEYWGGLLYPPPRDLPNPGIEPRSPALQADSFHSKLSGKPNISYIENLDVQAGFRKGRVARDQIANICWIIEKAREFQEKTSISALLTMPKPWLCGSQ